MAVLLLSTLPASAHGAKPCHTGNAVVAQEAQRGALAPAEVAAPGEADHVPVMLIPPEQPNTGATAAREEPLLGLQKPPQVPTVVAWAASAEIAPLADSRAACNCPAGCGQCSNASCCSGAVIPAGLSWLFPDILARPDIADSQPPPGRFDDPLPRPPSPLPLLQA